MSKVKVLFFAAEPDSPDTPLRLLEEMRAIQQHIRMAGFRDSFEFGYRPAARPADLIQALNETPSPQIVHFSGHGTSGGLTLVTDDGASHPVSSSALTRLFETFRGGIGLVVLNACYSLEQAEAIVKVVDCAIGTRSEIADDAAIVFASTFYGAIAFGHSVRQAFEQARTALALEGFPDDTAPELVCRAGVDPEALVLVPSEDNQSGQAKYFTGIEYSTHLPRPSFFAINVAGAVEVVAKRWLSRRDRDVGTLIVRDADAEFLGKKGVVRITNVRDVSHTDPKRKDPTTDVKVTYGTGEHPSEAYFSVGVLEFVIGRNKILFEALNGMARFRDHKHPG